MYTVRTFREHPVTKLGLSGVTHDQFNFKVYDEVTKPVGDGFGKAVHLSYPKAYEYLNIFYTYIYMKNAFIFTYGRMNPPTIGHLELIRRLQETARDMKADFKVYITSTQNSKKNPLSANEKINILREIAPGVPVEIVPILKSPGKKPRQASAQDIVEMATSNGYKRVSMMVGNNRMKNFKWVKANKISGGSRDPNANNATGASATKARDAVKRKNLKNFKRLVPVKNPEPLMSLIRSRMP